MCGILGGWWRHPPAGLELRLQAGLAALRHRGPNDQGLEGSAQAGGHLALGHTRLSILDLSPAGRQPRASTDGRYLITFNGEIYNYRELRRELMQAGRVFETDTDTEVLLQAWETWGEAALPRLVGMFAFAVLDRLDQSLTCVADPFAIKPLFWTCSPQVFAFASEPKALQTLLGEAPRLDWQRAYDYLVHGVYDSGERTFTSGVRRLRPGQLLRWSAASPSAPEIRFWWQPPVRPATALAFADAAAALRESFLESIRLHLRSDVPVGAALSGGLDSSAIVCAMRHVEPDLPIHTISFVAQGSPKSEEAWADRINAHVGARPHKVYVRPGELAAHLDDLIQAQGEPFGSTSIYAQYRVFRAAHEHGFTVMLEGQGADELLAGYQGYPAYRLQSLIESGHPLQALAFLRAWASWPGRSVAHALRHTTSLFMGDGAYHALRARIGKDSHPAWIDAGMLASAGVALSYPRLSPRSAPRGRRVVQALAEAISTRGLPALLRQGDRNAMRFSIENRVPFLTRPLADFLLSLPESYLVSAQGETKHILRAALRGIVPEDVLRRRDKVGFETPEHDWLRESAEQARHWLRDAGDIPFLRQAALLEAFEAILAGRQPFSWQAWRWINFVRWFHLTGMRP
ncbi:MAG: asparagine synthase (glutamine-hydrolyzing) [Pigmentiphaga sp.]|nr:asparagine synthase (glutamine-hydrolyzing) [Pigmentiphaga sp.]